MTMSRRKAMLVACSMTLAGCAGTPAEPRPAPATRAGVDEAAPYHCVRNTGTHIPLREGQCVIHAGRVYTADELRNTGAMNVQEALRKLGAY